MTLAVVAALPPERTAMRGLLPMRPKVPALLVKLITEPDPAVWDRPDRVRSLVPTWLPAGAVYVIVIVFSP